MMDGYGQKYWISYGRQEIQRDDRDNQNNGLNGWKKDVGIVGIDLHYKDNFKIFSLKFIFYFKIWKRARDKIKLFFFVKFSIATHHTTPAHTTHLLFLLGVLLESFCADRFRLWNRPPPCRPPRPPLWWFELLRRVNICSTCLARYSVSSVPSIKRTVASSPFSNFNLLSSSFSINVLAAFSSVSRMYPFLSPFVKSMYATSASVFSGNQKSFFVK